MEKLIKLSDAIKAFCEDGTWLERQGVYTLTLAEAKQRAVDVLESVPSQLHIRMKETDDDFCSRGERESE